MRLIGSSLRARVWNLLFRLHPKIEEWYWYWDEVEDDCNQD